MLKKAVNIGVIGFGTIGSSVVKILLERREFLRESTGIDFNILAVCDKDLSAKRDVDVPKEILTNDYNKVLNDPRINVVVELIGGVHPAKEIVLKALSIGKYVVTANKLLLAVEGESILKALSKADTSIYFEASVGGGIPIIKSIREGMVGNKFFSIFGILNGTSNYILSKMSLEGVSFSEALKEAQAKGYAEKDPGLDVKGLDSAHKLAILALLAFGRKIDMKDIYIEGIENISSRDIEYAKGFGYVIKLLGITKRHLNKIELRVHPTLIPSEYLLASVTGVYNAIFIDGDLVGNQLFYGQGAGKLPTASAVLSDIVDIAKHIACKGENNKIKLNVDREIKGIKKMSEVVTRYYVHFSAIDKPGVLAKIAELLGRHNISIASVVQKERREAKIVPIVMLTHEAREKDMQDALRKINKLDIIKRKTVVIRLEK